MSALVQENLDERIERIRKRDAEIEKRHREAEADRLMALKDNAMVKTKSPNDDDWPKGHKYDTLDFTYDHKDITVDDDKLKKNEKFNNYTPKPNRDYKKFGNGDGPPPDPSYNFLADAERDGVTEKSNSDRKDWRSTNNNNGNGGGGGHRNNKNNLNNSFRGRNNAKGNKNNINGANNNRYQRSDSMNDYSSWKNERANNDERSITGRQQKNSGDGKWRREWDMEKNSEPEIIQKVSVTNDYSNHDDPNHKSPKTDGRQQHQQQPQQQPLPELSIEKRGNITVSVSHDGEVKSVKLQSAKAIGTGRVGPRQSSKTHFSIQKEIVTSPTSVTIPEANYNNQYFNGKSMQPQQQSASQFQMNQQQQQQQQQPIQQFSMNQVQPPQQQMNLAQQQQQQQLQKLYQQFNGQQVKKYQQTSQPNQMLQNFSTQSPPQQIQIQQPPIQTQRPQLQQTLSSQSSIQSNNIETFNNYQQSQSLKQYDPLFDHKEIPIITPRSNLQDRISRHRINAAQLEEKSVDTPETTVSESAVEATPTSSATGTSEIFPITVGN